jgi:hypothetical protein
VLETHLNSVRRSFDDGVLETNSSFLGQQNLRIVIFHTGRMPVGVGLTLLGEMHLTSLAFIA